MLIEPTEAPSQDPGATWDDQEARTRRWHELESLERRDGAGLRWNELEGGVL